MPTWAPDGRRLAFTVDQRDGIGVWVADAETGTARQVPGWWSGTCSAVTRSRRARPPVVTRRPDAAGARRPRRAARRPAGSASRPSSRTSRRRPGSARRWRPSRTCCAPPPTRTRSRRSRPPSPAAGRSGDRRPHRLGPPGLYRHLTESPDGGHLLVQRLRRPFSFRVPCFYFARTTEVWGAAGGLERVVAELDVSDEVPRQGVPEGPRQVSWEQRAPASLFWVEALDGGDPVVPAEHRDRIMRLAAPFTGEPEPASRPGPPLRLLGWPGPAARAAAGRARPGPPVADHLALRPGRAGAEPGLVRSLSRRRLRRSWAPADDHQSRTGPGPSCRTARTIYLRGDGATPDGDRPFLDRLDLASGATTRLFQSPPDRVEEVIGFIGGRRDEIVGWHQSPAEPPNLFAAALDSPGPDAPAPAAERLARSASAADRADQAADHHRPRRRGAAVRHAAPAARLPARARRPAAAGDLGLSARLRRRGYRGPGTRQQRCGSPG